MKIIFGLGNPGHKYKNNRHNVGFMVVDDLARRREVSFKGSIKLGASIAKIKVGEEDVLLVKPRTFMNNSGLCSRKVLYRYVIPEENLLVVYDDADLPLGTIRFRRKGSSGGHQGMASVIDNIKSQDINRLRIGISKPFDADLTEHVLSDFSLEEKIILNEAISKAASGCIDWVNLGSDYVMRNYNK